MKKFNLLVLTMISLGTHLCFSQVLNYTCESGSTVETAAASGVSINGYGHTPKRNLQVMMVFVTFMEDDNSPGNDVLSPLWPKNNLPIYAQDDAYGDCAIMDINYQNPSAQSVHQLSLTKWYKEMSKYIPYVGSSQGNGFCITGKMFHIQIAKSNTFPPGVDKAKYLEKIYSQRAIAALNTSPEYLNEDWTAFDERANNPKYTSDNSITYRL